MSIRPLVTALSFVVFLLQACARQQSPRSYILFGKRDACSYINGQQYPYDWEGSDVGACVRKLPPQAQTVMVPDPIGGVFQVPQTEMNASSNSRSLLPVRLKRVFLMIVSRVCTSSQI